MADPPSNADRIFAQMSARSVAGPPPPPERRFVAGYPSHQDSVASLPLLEQIELQLLAQWAVDTHELEGFPVVKIICVGHADRDFQRGTQFEQQISERRSRAVRQFFENEIRKLSFDIWGMMQPGFIPVFSRIKFESTGIGSSKHVPAVNEAGRLRNRRVAIIFERDRSPQPPIVIAPFSILDITVLPLPHLPLPDPRSGPWFRPIPPAIKLPKSKLQEIIDSVRNSALKYLDLGSIAKATFNLLKDKIDPNLGPEERRKAEEDLAKDLRDWYEEEKRKRDNRTKDPPGDPDPE